MLQEADIRQFENQARECLIQYKNHRLLVSTNSEPLLEVPELTSPQDLDDHESLLKGNFKSNITSVLFFEIFVFVEIDECNLHANSKTVLKAVQGTEKNDEDLEQWLDDFLDD